MASGEPVGRGMALHDRSTYPAVRSGSTKVLRCGRGLAGVTGGALGDLQDRKTLVPVLK